MIMGVLRILSVLSVIIIIFSANLYSDINIDSLEKELEDAEGSARIEILINMCDEYKVSNHKKLLKVAKELLELAQKENNKPGISSGYSYIGTAQDEMGNFQEAVKNHQKALTIAEEINDKKRVALSLNNMGIIYFKLREFEKAGSYYQRSYEINRENDDKKGSDKKGEAKMNLSKDYGKGLPKDSILQFITADPKGKKLYACAVKVTRRHR